MSVQVKRDFDEVYATQSDPWSIGRADSERYDLYRDMLLEHAGPRATMLDIGSGFGAFVARFESDFQRLHAVDLTEAAVRTGRQRYPEIDFEQGSADALGETRFDRQRFDAIVYSDVICYFGDRGRRASLDWIAAHLGDRGVALIAAWVPGGKYLDAAELKALVERRFRILDERYLESEHAAFIVTKRRRLVALTIDYETWHPLPEGKVIDWDVDVIAPASALLDLADEVPAPLTIFAEVGEYLWLRENQPEVAERMAEQWQDAVRRGHEVQLHLHPHWLPELGARREQGRWIWDWPGAGVHDYPGDLNDLIARCKDAIEEAIRPADPEYKVSCFRAGAYEAQPFRRLYQALERAGIRADSSVYAGGSRPDRHYDYSLAYSTHQPYFASRSDPQLRAPPAETAIVELPLFSTQPNTRWTFDGDRDGGFADELLTHLGAATDRERSVESTRRRGRLSTLGARAYSRLRAVRPIINRVVPRRALHALAPHPAERLAEDEFYVLIGHSKADLDFDGIRRGLMRLATEVEFVGLSEMERVARGDLERRGEAPVRSEPVPVIADPARLHALVPLDRSRMLDLGSGNAARSEELAADRPWMHVARVDADADPLPFDDASFDCVYAADGLAGAGDVDRTLSEIRRVLADGGALVAAIPSDARNPGRACLSHAWKTAPHDVAERLAAAGFTNVEIDEADSLRQSSAAPFPPSLDRTMYVTAWRRPAPASARSRAIELAEFAYRTLDPREPNQADSLEGILAEGRAWCTGYAIATGLLLQRHGFRVRWATLLPDRPPPTEGPAEIDAHEVLEVELEGGRRVLDPMANVWFDHSLSELLANPTLAEVETPRDRRFVERSYEEYVSERFYACVRELAVRDHPREYQEFVPVEDFIRRHGEPPRFSAARRRLLRYREALHARARRRAQRESPA